MTTLDFNKMVEMAKNKTIGQNSVSDYVLFTMSQLDGSTREVMKSEMDKFFSRRGRRTEEDRLLLAGYQDYLIDNLDFTIANQETNDLGYIKYKNGTTLPVVVRINGYDFTESAISYYSTFASRTPEQELAVMVGKMFDMIPLEDGETIANIKYRISKAEKKVGKEQREH